MKIILNEESLGWAAEKLSHLQDELDDLSLKLKQECQGDVSWLGQSAVAYQDHLRQLLTRHQDLQDLYAQLIHTLYLMQQDLMDVQKELYLHIQE